MSDAAQRIVEALHPGAVVEQRHALEGGVSAEVEAIRYMCRDGAEHRVVLRRPPQPGGAALEFAVHRALRTVDLPVPEPLLLDGDHFAMDQIEGTTNVTPEGIDDALGQMAAFLAQLHELDPEHLDLPQLPQREDAVAGARRFLAPDAVSPELLAHLDAMQPLPQPSHLLHGDFWPGNVLWSDGRLVAVIDWDGVALGDPLCDLAGCRTELHWLHGEAAAEVFTAAYLTHRPTALDDLPIWELFVTAAGTAHMHEWGLDPGAEATMRRRSSEIIARAEAQVLRQKRMLGPGEQNRQNRAR